MILINVAKWLGHCVRSLDLLYILYELYQEDIIIQSYVVANLLLLLPRVHCFYD